MSSKKAFFLSAFVVAVLLWDSTALPLFYPWDECEEFQDHQLTDDSILIKGTKKFYTLLFPADSTNSQCPAQRLSDDMLIVIAHHVINVDTLDYQGFLDKKSEEKL